MCQYSFAHSDPNCYNPSAMFIQTFQSAFFAIFQVLLLAASGYVLVKIKVLDRQGLTQVSNLIVKFLFPLFIYFQMTNHFEFEKYSQWWTFPLIGVLLTALGYLSGKLASRSIRGLCPENEFLGLTTFQNAGYLPLMVVTALFPQVLKEQLYVYILLFVIAFNFIIWTFGVRLLIKSRPSAIPWNEILNPPFAAILFSLLIVFLGWHRLVPMSVVRPVEMLGNCTLPLSMLVVGGSLALIDIGDFNRKAMTWLVVTKLLIMPIVAMVAVFFLKLEFKLGFLIVIEAAVPSAVTLSVISKVYNIEGKFINQGLFFTHAVSIVTLPVFLAVYLMLTQTH